MATERGQKQRQIYHAERLRLRKMKRSEVTFARIQDRVNPKNNHHPFLST